MLKIEDIIKFLDEKKELINKKNTLKLKLEDLYYDVKSFNKGKKDIISRIVERIKEDKFIPNDTFLKLDDILNPKNIVLIQTKLIPEINSSIGIDKNMIKSLTTSPNDIKKLVIHYKEKFKRIPKEVFYNVFGTDDIDFIIITSAYIILYAIKLMGNQKKDQIPPIRYILNISFMLLGYLMFKDAMREVLDVNNMKNKVLNYLNEVNKKTHNIKIDEKLIVRRIEFFEKF